MSEAMEFDYVIVGGGASRCVPAARSAVVALSHLGDRSKTLFAFRRYLCRPEPQPCSKPSSRFKSLRVWAKRFDRNGRNRANPRHGAQSFRFG